MPALRPQSSAYNASYVAAGRQYFRRLSRMAYPVGGRTNGPLRNHFPLPQNCTGTPS